MTLGLASPKTVRKPARVSRFMTIHLLTVAGLSAEIFVDKPAKVSRFMDNLQTCHVSG